MKFKRVAGPAFCFGVLHLFLCAPIAPAFNFPRNSVRVDVRAEATPAAGIPILLSLTVTNVTKRPISYWSPGAGAYPPANSFKASVTDSEGKSREVELCNDADQAISGGIAVLQPGKSLVIPAILEPLTPGSYVIEVWKGKPAKVTIQKDAEQVRKWDEALVARIGKGEPYALYIARKYPTKSLSTLLLQELLSDDEGVAEQAAQPLLGLVELPENSGAIISKAMDKHLAALKQRGTVKTSILTCLAGLSAKIGTDNALENVLSLAQTKEVRGSAVWALGAFKQEKALKELRLFLTDQEEELQFRAAQRLAERKDPPALDVLLTVAHDPKSRWRMYSFDALLKYPDDPRVESAIKSGLNDPDSQVRQSAEFALRKLASQKK